jgi:hypothetical protein
MGIAHLPTIADLRHRCADATGGYWLGCRSGRGPDCAGNRQAPARPAPARFRTRFPDLADWLESPWTGPPPFLAGQVFRLEESIRDDRYVIWAELPFWPASLSIGRGGGVAR